MRHLGYSAPERLRCRLKGLSVPALVAEGAKLRPSRSPDPVTAATKASLSSLAHRISSLDDELAELDERIEALLVATVPDLLDLFGVGPDTAAALVMAAGDNPERLHSEPAWAHPCGVAPVPEGSGKTSGRVKAHDGGDRQANSALWRIVMVRIAHVPQTRGEVERFHQTEKKCLEASKPARSIAALQGRLDDFAEYYNEVRPHCSLGRRTPRRPSLPGARPGPPAHR